LFKKGVHRADTSLLEQGNVHAGDYGRSSRWPQVPLQTSDIVVYYSWARRSKNKLRAPLRRLSTLALRASRPTIASGATAGDLARLASDVAQVMGEEIDFEPRAVGPSLRELGFFTTGLGNRGIGIQFTRENRAKCHQLINEYGLSAAYVTDCRLCQKYLPNLQA
jgi:hypothetical protein